MGNLVKKLRLNESVQVGKVSFTFDGLDSYSNPRFMVKNVDSGEWKYMSFVPGEDLVEGAARMELKDKGAGFCKVSISCPGYIKIK